MTQLATADKADSVSLEEYRKQRYNVLVPTTTMQQISPFHKLRVEQVKVDPKPDSGDVFKVGSKYVGKDNAGDSIYEDVLSLSKTALMKISNAAGIVWNWNETKAVIANSNYVLYQAVGAFRKPSGEWLPLKASKEIDLAVVEEETYEANLKKANELLNSKYQKDKDKLGGLSPEQWAAAQTKSNMIQWRKNKLMRAETGAMLRVIRDLLAIKQQYSPSELQNPFIVPHVDFSPDYNDPEVRKTVMQYGAQATASLFGTSAPAPNQQIADRSMSDAFSQEARERFPDPDEAAVEEDPEEQSGSGIIEGSYSVANEPAAPGQTPVQILGQSEAILTCEHDLSENEKCGKKLSKAEGEYSIANYEIPLCFKHQKVHTKVVQ
jgi:hypothetical protein